jgi:hypothetical protein
LVQGYQRGVHLDADAFWRVIEQGYVAPWLPESREQNDTVIDVIAGAAVGYASGGYDVVIDGIVGPWYVEAFLGVVRESTVAVNYVVLRPSADVAMARALERPAPALTEQEPITKMYDEFSDLGEYERHVVDSSTMSAEETASRLADDLERGRFRLPVPTR